MARRGLESRAPRGSCRTSGSDVDAELDLPAGAELPPPVQRAVYRTVQEGLTNVRKHAPGSTVTDPACGDG